MSLSHFMTDRQFVVGPFCGVFHFSFYLFAFVMPKPIYIEAIVVVPFVEKKYDDDDDDVYFMTCDDGWYAFYAQKY